MSNNYNNLSIYLYLFAEPSVKADATYAVAGDEYKVLLTAIGNKFCKSYEWQHVG